MKRALYFLLLITLVACEASIEAKKELSKADYDALLVQLAPYVVKKPDALTYENRFDSANKLFYTNFIELTKAELTYYKKADTARFFSFKYRDLTSLKEDYRILGGYYRINENDSIVFVNLLYHTPRIIPEEIQQKGKMLFETMIKKGNVNRFIGNKNYVDTPNKDFYYNTELNRWDYTENSSWKFLEKAKQEALKDSIAN
jgi:hypothetical protein